MLYLGGDLTNSKGVRECSWTIDSYLWLNRCDVGFADGVKKLALGHI